MYISLNGKIISQNQGVGPLNGPDFLYGYGLFETLKVYDGEIVFLEDHLTRLILGCRTLKMSWSYTEGEIKSYCHQLLEANGIEHGVIRISYSRSVDGDRLLISTRENNYSEEIYEKGFKTFFSQTKRNPHTLLVGIKSNNYLENLILFNEGKALGYDEVLFLNIYNKVSEGAISNVFFVKGDIVYTPAEACGLLPGIIRQKVINICTLKGIKCLVGSFAKEELMEADEVFLTNSLLDIMPVTQIALDRSFDLKKNPITKFLTEELQALYR